MPQGERHGDRELVRLGAEHWLRLPFCQLRLS